MKTELLQQLQDIANAELRCVITGSFLHLESATTAELFGRTFPVHNIRVDDDRLVTTSGRECLFSDPNLISWFKQEWEYHVFYSLGFERTQQRITPNSYERHHLIQEGLDPDEVDGFLAWIWQRWDTMGSAVGVLLSEWIDEYRAEVEEEGEEGEDEEAEE